MKLDGIREKVFLDRYALKGKKGELLEHKPEEMWKRVAGGIAQNEKPSKRKYWAKKFYAVMEDFKFVPGGRILSGAGTKYQVTYFNCFVIPSPKDSRGGIVDSLKQLIEIQSRSGGVGLNLSSLRPRGARVKKVNGTSSGPVTWAGLFSYATHDVVQQGGTRRGATMLMLWDWHPDIEEFITVKQDLSKINGANLSVCISDAFIEAVKKDKDWDLVYPDLNDPRYDAKWTGDMTAWRKIKGKIKIHKTVKAKYLWDLICTAAWKSAEPGLHFLERSNKRSNTYYFETLIATNPCLTGDAWIHTAEGPRQVKDLLGTQFIARVNGEDFISAKEGFFKTGTKKVLSLHTKEGYNLRLTSDHKVQRVFSLSRYSFKTEWREAGNLKMGDLIVINNHIKNNKWEGKYNYEEGYLMGLLIGDGTLKSDKAILSVWKPDVMTGQTVRQVGVQGVMQEALQIAALMPHRSDFVGWTAVKGREEYRLSLAYIKKIAHDLGMSPDKKTITNVMEKTSSNFYKGLLKGLFDTDGSVQGNPDKGIGVRLSQSNFSFLQAVQRMLLRLGMASVIYRNRRYAGSKLLPNGKGGYKKYSTKAQHELVISGENLIVFAKDIGFADTTKSNHLTQLLSQYKRVLNRERFIAKVEEIISDQTEDVFDVQISGINAFDANGLYVHNCGEQPLGPWAVCNLGAMNLAAYVGNGKFDYKNFGLDVKVALRLLDNVIDQTYYFFKENEKCAKEIRRTGLGIMGIGDALIKMKIRYGSKDSMPVIKKIFETLRNNAYEESCDLAKEKGSFPKFNKTKYLEGYHIKNLPQVLQKKIAKQGIRNAVLLTIAPTGTTSLISGVSSGIEPVYEFAFKRKDRTGEHMMYHPLYEEWKKSFGSTQDKPDYFVSANDLTPLEHAQVQAVAQEFIDSSISKTVNAPNSHTVEDVKALYMAAYDLGLKGITYMRDGSREGVLERIGEKKEKSAPNTADAKAMPALISSPVISRPIAIEGVTYQAKTPVGEAFITINHNSNKEPFEMFITIGKSGSDIAAMAEALGRMVSLNLRLNGSLSPKERIRQVVAQLVGIGGARSIGFGKDKVRSLPDAVAKILSAHYGFAVNGKVEDKEPQLPSGADGNGAAKLPNGHANSSVKQNLIEADVVKMQQLSFDGGASAIAVDASTSLYDICPECGGGSLAYEEGCKKCYACGYSEC